MIESNHTENIFCVFARVPLYMSNMNMRNVFLVHFWHYLTGVYVYMFYIDQNEKPGKSSPKGPVTMCRSTMYQGHLEKVQCLFEGVLCTKEYNVGHYWHQSEKFYFEPSQIATVTKSKNPWNGQMSMWRCFCTWEYTFGHCWHQSEKLCFESSQIAAVTKCDKSESLPSHCVICRILWSWPWRHKLSPITLKTCSGYFREYPCSLFTWIWKVAFLPILALFHCYICLCECISIIKPMIDLQRKPSWLCSTSIRTYFLHWGVYPLELRTWIWEVVFWTVTKCDSHKMRQIRNPCRRILWFVAYLDHGRDGTNWAQ